MKKCKLLSVALYNLNFINLINRPTRTISELEKDEERFGVKRINTVINQYNPRVVCFIGKITYAKFIGHTHFAFGWQKDLFVSNVYVMHFPLRGRTSVRVKELQEIKKTYDQ